MNNEDYNYVVDKSYLFVINQIRYNRLIRGIYDQERFSFWFAISSYAHYKEHQTYPNSTATGFKDFIFDFYNIKKPTLKEKRQKVKADSSKFIDEYKGFDFKNEINDFCKNYIVKVNLYTYNPYVFPQYFKIGEFGNSIEEINLLVLPFTKIPQPPFYGHFFLITEPDKINGRLRNKFIVDMLEKNKKLLPKELKLIPTPNHPAAELYAILVEELRNKIL